MAEGARQGHAERDEDGADAGVRHGARTGVMDARAAARHAVAPDGQVLRRVRPLFRRGGAGAARRISSARSAHRSTSRQARALYATDASNYRQVPIGVVIRALDDVVEDDPHLPRARRADPGARRRHQPRRPGLQRCRRASTSRATSPRHRRSTRDARTARVEPGCILDRLRDAAEQPHGLMFGPDPATHDHNTLGGMIGNDSCGVHSVKWGRTADNVGGLDVLTYDGLQLELGPTRDRWLRATRRSSAGAATSTATLVALRDRYGELIEQRFPKIPRLRVGLRNLDDAAARKRLQRRARADRHRRHVRHRARGGGEAGAPPERARASRLLSFDDVFAAADAVPALLEQEPRRPSRASTTRCTMRCASRSSAADSIAFPQGHGFLIVEAGGDRPRRRHRRTSRRMVERAGTGGRYHVVTDRARAAAHLGGARGGARSHRIRSRPARALARLGGQRRSARPSSATYLRDLDGCSPSTATPRRSTAISATA